MKGSFLLFSGRKFKEKGFPRLAIWCLERAVKVLEGEQEKKEAFKLLEEAKEEFISYLREKAENYEKEGDYTEALIMYERIKDAGGEVDESHLEELRKKARKKKKFEVELLFNPRSMGFNFARNYRQWLFSITGVSKYDEAFDSSDKIYPPELLVVWKKAYENPESYEAQYELARAFASFGYMENALSQARILSKKWQKAEAELLLANVLSDLGRKEEAAEHYLKAAEMRPDLQEAYFYLGKLYLEMDDEIAIHYFRKCVEINPSTDIAAEALELIKGIMQNREA